MSCSQSGGGLGVNAAGQGHPRLEMHLGSLARASRWRGSPEALRGEPETEPGPACHRGSGGGGSGSRAEAACLPACACHGGLWWGRNPACREVQPCAPGSGQGHPVCRINICGQPALAGGVGGPGRRWARGRVTPRAAALGACVWPRTLGVLASRSILPGARGRWRPALASGSSQRSGRGVGMKQVALALGVGPPPVALGCGLTGPSLPRHVLARDLSRGGGQLIRSTAG